MGAQSLWVVHGGGGQPSAYRSCALLPGIQRSSQAIRCLGGFVLDPETQRQPWSSDTAVLATGLLGRARTRLTGPGGARSSGRVRVGLSVPWAWKEGRLSDG